MSYIKLKQEITYQIKRLKIVITNISESRYNKHLGKYSKNVQIGLIKMK